MDKINLDSPDAKSNLAAIRLSGNGKPFDCTVKIGGTSIEFTGHFSGDTSNFFMTKQSKSNCFLTLSDDRKLIEMVEKNND